MKELTMKDAELIRMIAEARKLEAEARSLEPEAEDLETERRIREAELRAAAASADEAEHSAISSRIARDAQLRAEEFALLADHYHQHLHFNGPVDAKSVDKALQQLALWDRRDAQCDMNMHIQSEGGSALDGLHLFDQLVVYSQRGKLDKKGKKLCGGDHKVTITVRGYAASMGAILVQAADERVIGPEAWLMIHKVSAGAAGKATEIMNTAKFLEHMCDRIANIFVERSNGGIDLETFKARWEHNDWWLDAEQALEFGFVDRIG